MGLLSDVYKLRVTYSDDSRRVATGSNEAEQTVERYGSGRVVFQWVKVQEGALHHGVIENHVDAMAFIIDQAKRCDGAWFNTQYLQQQFGLAKGQALRANLRGGSLQIDHGILKRHNEPQHALFVLAEQVLTVATWHIVMNVPRFVDSKYGRMLKSAGFKTEAFEAQKQLLTRRGHGLTPCSEKTSILHLEAIALCFRLGNKQLVPAAIPDATGNAKRA
jgi:hypothetical protein